MVKRVKPFSNNQGVHLGFTFYCPACESHHYFDSKWTFNNSLERPTVSPSIRVLSNKDYQCHLFIEDGFIKYLGDCTHNYAGRTVELEEA